MIFYTGIHVLSIAPHLERCCISINRLVKDGRDRQSDFLVNNWILDSGAFSEISSYGFYRSPVNEYARRINRWAKCGNLELAVSQDYMCEPFILNKTGLTIAEHQRLTIQRYDELISLTSVPIMPVLQGYAPSDYVNHLHQYGNRLKPNMRVGVGSVCKRNGKPDAIVNVLQAIKQERPDLKLHGFGLKTTALENNYILSMLYSADSAAWSYAARRQGLNRNGAKEAIDFTYKIEHKSGRKFHQFVMIPT